MTLTKQSLFILGTLAILAVVYFMGTQISQVYASAPSGLPSTVATTSTPSVTTTANLVFATSTTCAARIVSTGASAITLGFSDSQGFVPSGLVGHVQAASTTVAYDSGLYGCGAVRIYSFVAQTITVAESR